MKQEIDNFLSSPPATTCDEQAAALNERVRSVIDTHAPMRRIKERTFFRTTISEKTSKLMYERDLARRLIKKISPAERHIQFEKYRTLRNRVISSLRHDRKRRAEDEIKNGTNVWRVAENIIGKEKHFDLPLNVGGKPIGNDLEKAEYMNTYP